MGQARITAGQHPLCPRADDVEKATRKAAKLWTTGGFPLMLNLQSFMEIDVRFIIGIAVALLGIGQLLYGFLTYSAASSAMHQILGAVQVGSGSICLGILGLMAKPSEETETRVEINPIKHQ